MRMNAVKHGCDAAAENEAAVMRALGEDPERYAALKRELATAYGPGDSLWDQQIEDLAKLYWRRQRIERMVTGLMREALEAVEERRRGLARALADVTFEASQCEAVALDLPQPTHPLVRRRLLISLLGVILTQIRRRDFRSEQRSRMESSYQGQVGWRPRQICHLLLHFSNWACRSQEGNQARVDEYVKDNFGSEAGFEARYQELVRLLEEQVAGEEAAFAEEMKAQEEKCAIEQDTCLVPEDETAERLLRHEAALDRSIDRKVRILMTMRKEHARERGLPARTATPHCGLEARAPGNEPNDREAQELSKLVGLGSASEVEPNFSSAHADPSMRSGQAQKVSAAKAETESPAKGEGGLATPKSPEQSQNVVENKAPLAEGVEA